MGSTRKRRILLANEASFQDTGYAVYGREVLKRLHAAGEFEVAEFGVCADPSLEEHRAKAAAIPWPFFYNVPPAGDPRRDRYNPRSADQFGGFSFEDVLLEFRPDVVWDIRDHWMAEFAERSPLRRHFRWAYMPTVDSVPQMDPWVATFMAADAVFSYTDWGADVLRRQGGGLINVLGSAPPAADYDVFTPMDRRAVRDGFNLDEDALIVGTVMRNQPRKLYPNLIADFARFLEVAPPGLARRTFLYLHVSYPDEGWKVPTLIRQSGIGRKVLVTYQCRSCGVVQPQFYSDASAPCPSCRGRSMGLPNVRSALGREALAAVINAFDVYVQYANSEGFGMPQVEAAACGVPVFAVDYSAMSDVVRKVGGVPIAVRDLVMEPHFGTYRAIPDGADFARQLVAYLSLSAEERAGRGRGAARLAREHYSWDATAEKWAACFRSLAPAVPWDAPARLHTPPPVPPEFPSHEDLVRWAISEYLGRPELADSYLALRLVRDLNWGVRPDTAGGSYHNEDSLAGRKAAFTAFTPEDALAELKKMVDLANHWEQRRCNP